MVKELRKIRDEIFFERERNEFMIAMLSEYGLECRKILSNWQSLLGYIIKNSYLWDKKDEDYDWDIEDFVYMCNFDPIGEYLENNEDLVKEEINDRSFNPLYWAIMRRKDISIVRSLLEMGSDPNFVDTKGNPLLTTVVLEHSRTNLKEEKRLLEKYLTLLLDYGAYIDMGRRIDGSTPLMVAALVNDLDMVKILIKRGAVINLRSKAGETPVFFAVYNRNYDMLKCFVEHGSAVNILKSDNYTPLLVSIVEKDIRIIKYLIDHGARTDCQSNGGTDPVVLARDEEVSNEIIHLLRKYKKNPIEKAYKKENIEKKMIKNILKIYPEQFRDAMTFVVDVLGVERVREIIEKGLGSLFFVFMSSYFYPKKENWLDLFLEVKEKNWYEILQTTGAFPGASIDFVKNILITLPLRAEYSYKVLKMFHEILQRAETKKIENFFNKNGYNLKTYKILFTLYKYVSMDYLNSINYNRINELIWIVDYKEMIGTSFYIDNEEEKNKIKATIFKRLKNTICLMIIR